MKKQAKMGLPMIIFIICAIAVVGILGYAVFIKPSDTLPSQPGLPPAISGCNVEDTTVKFSALTQYTSAAAGGSHLVRVNGAPAVSVADAGEITTSPGDKVQVLWGNASLTGNFGVIESYDIPCVGIKTVTTTVVNNGTITTRVFNEEGNIIDTAGENETLTNGDTVNLNWEIQGTYQKAFPHGIVLVIEYNSSALDDVAPSLNGVALATATVPTAYAGTSYGSTSKKVAYLIPPLMSNTKQVGTIALDADDTLNPGDAYNGDISFTYYPKNNFVNEDDAGAFAEPAAEDEDNAVTRTGTFTYTLSID